MPNNPSPDKRPFPDSGQHSPTQGARHGEGQVSRQNAPVESTYGFPNHESGIQSGNLNPPVGQEGDGKGRLGPAASDERPTRSTDTNGTDTKDSP